MPTFRRLADEGAVYQVSLKREPSEKQNKERDDVIETKAGLCFGKREVSSATCCKDAKESGCLGRLSV